MSQELYEERLGHVEAGLAGVKADVRVLSHDLAALKGDVGKIGQGVERLLTREASRPEPTSAKNILYTLVAALGGIGAVATAVWWFIAASPIVQDLDKRLSRLDDPEIGKVTRLERDRGWDAMVKR